MPGCRFLFCLAGALAVACGSFDPVERRQSSASDYYEQLREHTEAALPGGPLSLRHCLETALANNLELELATVEAALSEAEEGARFLELLPRLGGRAELSHQDPLVFSTSSFLLGGGGIRDSFATAKEHKTVFFLAELAFSPLDFGLALFSRRQAELGVMERRQNRLRIAQKISATVAAAYARMQSTRISMPELEEGLKLATERAEQLETLHRSARVPLRVYLEAREDEDRQREALFANRAAHAQARNLLASAMGIAPDARLAVETAGALPEDLGLPELGPLLERSLLARPELFQADLRQEQAALELSKAWLRIFPNVRIFGNFTFDENKHLLHNSYQQAGLEITYDLLQSLFGGRVIETARRQKDRLARDVELVSMNVLLQVRMAHLTLARAVDHAKETREAFDRARKLADFARLEEEQGRGSGLDRRLADMNARSAHAQWMAARSELRIARIDLLTAAGLPLLPVADHAERQGTP
ncbi:MAG: TolC family protein [Planctomycetota bacterium]